MIATLFNLDSVEVIQAPITRIKTVSDLAFDKGAKLEFGNLNHIQVAQASALYAGGKAYHTMVLEAGNKVYSTDYSCAQCTRRVN